MMNCSSSLKRSKMKVRPLPEKTKKLLQLFNQIIRQNQERGMYVTRFCVSREYWKLLNPYAEMGGYTISLSKTDENSFSGYFHIHNDISIPFTSKLENIEGYIDENPYY